MDQVYSTTLEHQKGKHLTRDESVLIQIRRKDGWSPNRIAAEIGCAPNTVRNELRRGTVNLYRGHVQRYKADAGQKVYEEHRTHSVRSKEYLQKSAFLGYVKQHFFEDGWSLDACVGRAISRDGFSRNEVVCTRTLYTYVDLGLIGIANHQLPEKLSRNTKRSRVRKNKRVLGRSIEERDPSIERREEFGHWEFDLVLGSKKKGDEVLLTMIERMSCNLLIIPLSDKSAQSVMHGIESLRATYGEHWNEVFKTITTDNGSEFSALSQIEQAADTLVYYAHPYTSCDKATVERHNGLIRRFIPKGKRVDSYTAQQISEVELWCNGLPRKILGYRTPEEVFDEQLDRIYRVA